MKEITLEVALKSLGNKPFTFGIKDGKKKLLRSNNSYGIHFLEEDGKITLARAWDLTSRKFYVEEPKTVTDQILSLLAKMRYAPGSGHNNAYDRGIVESLNCVQEGMKKLKTEVKDEFVNLKIKEIFGDEF